MATDEEKGKKGKNAGKRPARAKNAARTTAAKSKGTRTKAPAPPPDDPAGLPASPESRARTQTELDVFADLTVEFVNRTLKGGYLAHELVADVLFDRLTYRDSTAALKPGAKPTPEFDAVAARAGHSLHLDKSDLSRHVRIGALNQRLDDDDWRDLTWTKKRELLPLVDANLTLDLLRKGIAYARTKSVGILDVRDWVQRELPKPAGTSGAPRRVTPAAGKKMLATGLRLEDEQLRHGLVTQVKDAPAKERRAFVRDAKKVREVLDLLIADLESPDEE